MQLLNLEGNQIGDTGMISLADALGKGALAALETLDLRLNAIGDAGMSALAKAITPGPNGKGALPQLGKLFLGSNKIGDSGLWLVAHGRESRNFIFPSRRSLTHTSQTPSALENHRKACTPSHL